jgi:hypothetical protein
VIARLRHLPWKLLLPVPLILVLLLLTASCAAVGPALICVTHASDCN